MSGGGIEGDDKNIQAETLTQKIPSIKGWDVGAVSENISLQELIYMDIDSHGVLVCTSDSFWDHPATRNILLFLHPEVW